jgi:hypothetical protein
MRRVLFEHFQEKWNPVFRPKMRQCEMIERFLFRNRSMSIRRAASYHLAEPPGGCSALLPTTETFILMLGSGGASGMNDMKHG